MNEFLDKDYRVRASEWDDIAQTDGQKIGDRIVFESMKLKGMDHKKAVSRQLTFLTAIAARVNGRILDLKEIKEREE